MTADHHGQPERVLLLGDTHGSERWIARAASVANEMGLGGIVQLGDLGYLPDDSWHQRFLATSERLLASVGVPLWFLRGNHDDADGLARLVSTGCGDAIGAVHVSPHIRYLPCGTRWTWGATRLGALGGAFSVDRHDLVEGTSWWPGELIDPAAVARLGNEPLDVLLTHEAPLWSRTILDQYPHADGPIEQTCTSQRRLVEDAMRATRASVVVHGHHHLRYDEITGTSRSIGLACETWDSMVVLDTATGSISTVCPAAMHRTAARDDARLRTSQYALRHSIEERVA